MIYDETLDRLEIIRKIEKNSRSKIITLYDNVKNNSGMINEKSVENFQLAMNRIGNLDPVTIIINSKGGETYSGFRIAEILKNRQGPVNVIIPQEALSAATLIAISAKKIIMTDNAYVSPVEPQYFYNDLLVSALDLMNSDDRVIKSKARRAL